MQSVPNYPTGEERFLEGTYTSLAIRHLAKGFEFSRLTLLLRQPQDSQLVPTVFFLRRYN